MVVRITEDYNVESLFDLGTGKEGYAKAKLIRETKKEFKYVKRDREIDTTDSVLFCPTKYVKKDEIVRMSNCQKVVKIIVPEWMSEEFESMYKELMDLCENLYFFKHDLSPGRPKFWTEKMLNKIYRMMNNCSNFGKVADFLYSKYGHKVKVQGGFNCFCKKWWLRKKRKEGFRKGPPPRLRGSGATTISQIL